MLAVLGVSFLTPLDALFVLAAAAAARRAPAHRAARRARPPRARPPRPGRRASSRSSIALVLLPALVAVAAAQPVVVREQLVSERADAQAFVVFDTSLSMRASARHPASRRGSHARSGSRCGCSRRFRDVPIGIASMTDRSLPNLMPTTDSTLFDRTVLQSIAHQPAAAEPGVQDARDDVRTRSSRSSSRTSTRRACSGACSSSSPTANRRRSRRCLKLHAAPPRHARCSCTCGSRASGSSTTAGPTAATSPTRRARRRSTISPRSPARRTSFEEGDFGAIARASRDGVGRAGTRTRIDCLRAHRARPVVRARGRAAARASCSGGGTL